MYINEKDGVTVLEVLPKDRRREPKLSIKLRVTPT